ncbi:hypothetical protein AB0J84_31915 [Micromonospora arborensis]|uniref:hypothetical protein n=1 Tax=Micromonospora arborensis TaxID=2116518 RepID=UPI003441F13E
MIDANYFMTAIAVAGTAATSLCVAGLESLIGLRALGIGTILTIFISNPSRDTPERPTAEAVTPDGSEGFGLRRCGREVRPARPGVIKAVICLPRGVFPGVPLAASSGVAVRLGVAVAE